MYTNYRLHGKNKAINSGVTMVSESLQLILRRNKIRLQQFKLNVFCSLQDGFDSVFRDEASLRRLVDKNRR
jgi:hypothetical protein